MPLAHVTQTGNVSIPKSWRDELGIEPGSTIIMERIDYKIVIEPMTRPDLFKKMDEEAKRKNIKFTREEAIRDDLYD